MRLKSKVVYILRSSNQKWNTFMEVYGTHLIVT